MFHALSEQLQSVKGIQISETELRRKLVNGAQVAYDVNKSVPSLYKTGKTLRALKSV